MAPDDETGIYRDLMRFKPNGISANAWAVKAGVSRTVWADMRRHGNPSRRTLEKLLAAAGSSLAEFEALRVGSPSARASMPAGSVGEGQRWAWSAAPVPPLPLLASSLAGEWGNGASPIELMEIRPGEPLEKLPRPPSLASDRDAYAVTVVGDSMWPRFRPGRRVAVSPRSPAAVGDDVVVHLRHADAGAGRQLVLLKALVKRSADALELRQFNPDVTFSVGSADVEAMHKVCGELI